jgi:hypothetical protein
VQLLESATDTLLVIKWVYTHLLGRIGKNQKAGFGIQPWFSIFLKNFASSLVFLK